MPVRPTRRRPDPSSHAHHRGGGSRTVNARRTGHVDVADIRARFPLADVVSTAGVELHPRGHGWVGCCPFHEDTTPSLSVDGVPDRFHCFGCGASGDVVDFIQRLHGLDFRDAVAMLESHPGHPSRHGAPARPGLRLVRDTDTNSAPSGKAGAWRRVSAERGYDINAMAWRQLTGPVHSGFASHYLSSQRGLDLNALPAEQPGTELIGYASGHWTSLTDQLRSDGVSDDELVAMDLAQHTRTGSLIDTLRYRLIVPLRNDRNQIEGFVGRDISGRPAAPKYRNPTRTPTYEKSRTLYRPTFAPLAPDGRVVLVEGVFDALALAAAAAATGASDQIAACAASGVTVSAEQADQVLAISVNPPVIALDADDAGREGTDRWLTALCLERHRPAFVLRLPHGHDPASWIAEHGPAGIGAFLPDADLGTSENIGSPPCPALPGRDLARLALIAADDPIRDTVAAIAPVARRLSPGMRTVLVAQATDEMTRSGWNPHQAFARAIDRELAGLHPVHKGPAPVLKATAALPDLL
ncbi:CHC2 zinc finger domain-containing protein [Terrabacter sp. GCM10028922]|uniref:CHC2 zinc finger domain-containing protein n=1 Tax=Terrabacter sp. GCM10028922 TaxID=3273428 RepID=UPI00361A6C71